MWKGKKKNKIGSNEYHKVLSDCLAYVKKKLKRKNGSSLLFYVIVCCKKERYFKEEQACKKSVKHVYYI